MDANANSCSNNSYVTKVSHMRLNLHRFHFYKKPELKKKGSKTPGKKFIASISKNDKKIAEDKMKDLNTVDINSLKK